MHQAVKAGRPFAAPVCGLECREKSLRKLVGERGSWGQGKGGGGAGGGPAISVYEQTLIGVCVLLKQLYFINQAFL